MIDGQADQETGLPEYTDLGKDDASLNRVKQSMTDLSQDNKSLSSTYLSHEPNKFGERNSALGSIQRYRTKIISQSQLSGETAGFNRNIQIKFGNKSSGLRN